MLLLTFNPGLTLTGFQTTQPRWLTEYFFFSQHEAIKSPTLHLSLSLSLSLCFSKSTCTHGEVSLVKMLGILVEKNWIESQNETNLGMAGALSET